MATLNKAEAKRYRASKHAKRSHTMPCGKVVRGNGGQHAHQNRCRECLTAEGAYLSDSMRDAIRGDMRSWAGGHEDLLAAYRQWQREEGDRLLAVLDAKKSSS